jgi:hypothetical protein
MRSSLYLVLSATVFAGCSLQKGQTPDDVFFSPQRQHDEYVSVKERIIATILVMMNTIMRDQYLRMKVHNRVAWSEFDDWYTIVRATAICTIILVE